MSNLTLKTLSIALFCASLSACGGDDPVVESDGGVGGGTGGQAGGGAGGQAGEREGNGPDLPDGTALVATSGPVMSVEFPCKIEIFDGTTVTSETAVTRTLAFDPEALTLSVDGEVTLDGALVDSTWGYINQSSEYENASTGTNLGVTEEVTAKIFHTGAPAYLRSKTTATDFSYEQLECYQGLIVQ
jgi:hypothetical protein